MVLEACYQWRLWQCKVKLCVPKARDAPSNAHLKAPTSIRESSECWFSYTVWDLKQSRKVIFPWITHKNQWQSQIWTPAGCPSPRSAAGYWVLQGLTALGEKTLLFNLHRGGKRHVPDTKPIPLPNFTPPFQCIMGGTPAASRKPFSPSASLPSWGTSPRSSLFTM